jgi:TRAP-type mannitol/chloroaromatic compound transport system substrate-binding protein
LKAAAAATALAAALASAGPALAQDKQSHSFQMATGWAGGPLMEIGAQAFADKVKEMTEGRITIEVFPAGTLGPGLKVTETVKNGVAQMGHTWIGYDWGADPTAVLFGGYAGSFDTEKMLHWLYRAGGAELQAEWRMEKFDVVSIPLFIRTAEVFLHSRKPVRTLGDLKGLKLRTAGAWLDISRSMGAAPVTTPGGEVYTALERGAIDATEWVGPYDDLKLGFHAIAPNYYMPGWWEPGPTLTVQVNRAAYDELPPTYQEILAEVCMEANFNMTARYDAENPKALTTLVQEHGVQLRVFPTDVMEAAWRESNEYLEEQAAANAGFQRVYDSFKQFREVSFPYFAGNETEYARFAFPKLGAGLTAE